MLVIWLHTHFQLPFKACNAVLYVFSVILNFLCIPLDPPMFTTLPTIMEKMDIEPSFNILPVCVTCKRPYPENTASCFHCQEALYDKTPTVNQRSKGRTEREIPKPRLRYPYLSLSSQLANLVPDIEDSLDEWRRVARKPGEYTDQFDGRVCQEVKGPDDLPFFRPDLAEMPDGELRIGLTMGLDWFSYHRILIAPSHSSCPVSFNIVNLPPSIRYRAANLLLVGVLPGPQEQDGDQVQYFIHITVDELLILWKDGICIVTKRFPLGRLVRVILVGVICDKPAAHKVGAYGSHSHTYFCTLCWIEKTNLCTPQAFTPGAFRTRTNSEHRTLQERYRSKDSKTARAQFVKEYATRWSELSRLPYFDFSRMIVVDPMHNLFLGLVKNHFYVIWVKLKVLRKTKELRRLHAMLAELSMPAKLGRLPSLVGEPAGGSLTADQWRILATVVGPLVIPQIWQDYMAGDPEVVLAARKTGISELASEKRKQSAAARKQASKQRSTRGKSATASISTVPSRKGTRTRKPSKRLQESHENNDISDDDDIIDDGAIEVDGDDYTGDGSNKRRKMDDDDNDRGPNLHPSDVVNFLKLCHSLQLLLSGAITEAEISKAEQLVQSYCVELIELYGPDVIKPNHHYAIHLGQFVRDHGPLYCFWTFLFERMNKVLKTFKTNNHSGGEIETTFFREFHRSVRVSQTLSRASSLPAGSGLPSAVEAMYRATADDRGTVQSLASELDKASELHGIKFQLSKKAEKMDLPQDVYNTLLEYFGDRFPTIKLCPWLSMTMDADHIPMQPTASFFDHVILCQNRVTSATRSNAQAESLITVRTSDLGRTWVGELQHIFKFSQAPLGSHHFGFVRWLKPLRSDLSAKDTPWENW
ncbi:hypothetical protein K474DRAFT_1686422 [Panus rudis PR-1116 ss-1]|nr:hypothetical protein K474DRAFT_1686422 [Panus rudis PR-1116 ss-1]